jgi:hypothetical protein
MQVRELEALRKEIERRAEKAPRWNADPKDVQKSVVRLVLALIEFLRKLLEKQASAGWRRARSRPSRPRPSGWR